MWKEPRFDNNPMKERVSFAYVGLKGSSLFFRHGMERGTVNWLNLDGHQLRAAFAVRRLGSLGIVFFAAAKQGGRIVI